MNRRTFLAEASCGLGALVLGIRLPTVAADELIPLNDGTWLATVLVADRPNSNKRIYPTKVIEKAIKNFNGGHGHLGMVYDSLIHFADISHYVRSLFLRENRLECVIIPLNTPNGRIMQDMMLKNEVLFRTSGIGGGELNKNGYYVIDESYCLTSVNAVPKNEAAIL